MRIGTYAQFFEAGRRSLSSADAPALRALGARDASDPLVAWLDGWAVVADVLTFYRERYARETYLRTALEEMSLRELARQVGYKPRPGVSASVPLAYLLDPTAKPATIPAGAKAQSVPKPGEQMQTFETSEPLEAHAEFSQMLPRQTRLPAIDRVDALLRQTVRLDDPSLSVRPGERLLFLFGKAQGQQVVREVAASRADGIQKFTELTLKPRTGLNEELATAVVGAIDDLLGEIANAPAGGGASALQQAADAVTSYMLGASASDAEAALPKAPQVNSVRDLLERIQRPPLDLGQGRKGFEIDSLFDRLGTAPASQPRSSRLMQQAVAARLDVSGVARASLLSQVSPQMARNLYPAWSGLPANPSTPDKAPKLYLLRLTTGAFGAAAPVVVGQRKAGAAIDNPALKAADKTFAFLDVLVDGLASDGYALVDCPLDGGARTVRLGGARTVRLGRVLSAQTTARFDYGLTAKVTRLELTDLAHGQRLTVPVGEGPKLSFLRSTIYAVQSQKVTLASEAILDDVAGDSIMLDRLYEGIKPGRWIVVAGERTDLVAGDEALGGVLDGELALVAGVTQEPLPRVPGDAPRTVLHLETPLAYSYLRTQTTIYGNVVHATHGESVSETIGSGNAAVRFQTFALRRSPLTFVAAANTSGVAGTQVVRANGALAQEVDTLMDTGPHDRAYELSVDQDGAAMLRFGDGVMGMRAPTGTENIKAAYRVGIGSVGNVDAQQITLLTTRPLGVQGVLNPLAATGGADRDSPGAIRANAPIPTLALSPLSRLVSVKDYEYFARRFAGIGDARAALLSDGAYRCVHVTVAGVDDTPLAVTDDLVTSLAAAFEQYGDPALPVVIAVRELIALFIQASIVCTPDADPDDVEPAVRARLYDSLSFASRRLARPAYRSEVTAMIQSTKGVDRVEVQVFGGVSEVQVRNRIAFLLAARELSRQAAHGDPSPYVLAAPPRMGIPVTALQPVSEKGAAPQMLPAQTAYLVPSAPDTLVLNFG
jgi:hypothetical protein